MNQKIFHFQIIEITINVEFFLNEDLSAIKSLGNKFS